MRPARWLPGWARAIGFYKVGMELYAAAGMDFVRELLGQGKDVFLDLKYYDIGETVKRAVRVAAAQRRAIPDGAWQQPGDARGGRGPRRMPPTRLLAVTVLTSFDQQDLADMGYECTISDLVSLRVRKAMEAGMDGLVCSPLDAAAVRAQAGAASHPGDSGRALGRSVQRRSEARGHACRGYTRWRGLRGDRPPDHARGRSRGGGSARSRRDRGSAASRRVPVAGLISDTHGLMRDGALRALEGSDLIIHAGDVGKPEILDALKALAPLVAVRGNVDKGAWASALPVTAVARAGAAAIYVLHDVHELDLDPVAAGFQVVVSGHSHQPGCREQGGVLFINPGSAGPRRFKLPVTVARLDLGKTPWEVAFIQLDGRENAPSPSP